VTEAVSQEEVRYVDEATVISEYSLEQAIEDGVLVQAFDEYIGPFVSKYVDGKPVVATTHLFNQVSHDDLLALWNKFIVWRQDVCPALREEDRMFVTEIHGKKVWVDETERAVTMMYPEDY
jgi:type I site-specific restriction endonuclease